ncbi:MAG: hypothetical protein GY903_30340 [Fuerstiella sp.]|nr:hypothetical protein [Fuerstiella sp.]MCP4858794.1 hypothetical protein [Fuerstiella sp.]
MFGSAAAAVTDVTAPGDSITAVGGAAANGFEASKAIDNQTATKYVNDGGADSGYEVTPASGASIVNSLAFKTADNNPDADPGSYKLEGQLADGSYATISEQNLSLPAARHNASTRVYFSNIVPFSKYRLTFPTLKVVSSSTMQITEVWMFGTAYSAPTGPSGPGVLLKLTDDTWQGTDSANAHGAGTDTLTLSAAGVAALTGGMAITDSASGASVKFADSGSTTYSTPINVTLDDAAAGAITFDGKTSFAGSASLSAATSRNIVISSNAEVKTVNGSLSLSANQQSAATEGNFSGVAVSGVVEATGSGVVTVAGRAGSKSTQSELCGVKLDGGRIVGGIAGTLDITGHGGIGITNALSIPNKLVGVSLTNTSTITSAGANVQVIGTGGDSDAGWDDGISVLAGSTITAGGGRCGHRHWKRRRYGHCPQGDPR